MGVVSGVVMSYQFGTNWSLYADHVGNVLGPLFAFEVLTSFFLEASFLGVMLFGWGRVSPRMHFISTCIVAVGTLMSAFWILAANSWMQTPQGYTVGADGRFFPADWLAIIFNPSLPFRYIHMIFAAYLTLAFVIGGVGALYLKQGRFVPEAKKMLRMGAIMAMILTPLQFLVGHEVSQTNMKYQPLKMSAAEGIWETQKGASFRVFAVIDQEKETNSYELSVPKLASQIMTENPDGEVKGIKEWKPEDRPNVSILFMAVRVMVYIFFAMFFTAVFSIVKLLRGKLYQGRILTWWTIMMPSGFLAILGGWVLAEAGRQPYTAYGILRTSKSLSPALVGPEVLWSLLSFVVIYIFVFGSGSYYIFKLIRKGIPKEGDTGHFFEQGMKSPFLGRHKKKEATHV
jgi:cytochrome bd ubiquinol oxidase subunit I